jgi:hypothetical protein
LSPIRREAACSNSRERRHSKLGNGVACLKMICFDTAMLRLESTRTRASANNCMFINQCHSAGYYLIILSAGNSDRYQIKIIISILSIH